jgi:hypothetical protein
MKPSSPLPDLSRLCIHTITTKPWAIETSAAKFAAAGVKGITVWRDTLAGRDIKQTGQLLRDQGLSIVSLCRGTMTTHKVGIIMNGVTGRMGTNQHLLRSIKAIIDQGGIKLGDAEVIMPDPILVGRSEIQAGGARGPRRCQALLDQSRCGARGSGEPVYFDATLTGQRPAGVRKAIAAKKHIYCENRARRRRRRRWRSRARSRRRDSRTAWCRTSCGCPAC